MVSESTAPSPVSSPLDHIEINVDCGEAYGQWSGGPDEELMPIIDAANIACGGHAGDPVIMRRTIALAKKHGVKIGAREWCPGPAGRCVLIDQIPAILTRLALGEEHWR